MKGIDLFREGTQGWRGGASPRKEQGASLVIVIVMTVVVMALIVGVMTFAEKASEEVKEQTTVTHALEEAETGLGQFLMEIQKEPLTRDENGNLMGWIDKRVREGQDSYSETRTIGDTEYNINVRSAYLAYQNNPNLVGFAKAITPEDRNNLAKDVFDYYEIKVQSKPKGKNSIQRGVYFVAELKKDIDQTVVPDLPAALYLEDTTPEFNGNDFIISGEDHTASAKPESDHPDAALIMPRDGKLKVVFQSSSAALDSAFWMIDPFSGQEKCLLPSNHPDKLLESAFRNDANRKKALTEWTGVYKAGEKLTFFARVDATPWGRGIYDHYCVGHFDPWFTEKDSRKRKMSYCAITLWRKKSPDLPDGVESSYELYDGLPASDTVYDNGKTVSKYYKRGGFVGATSGNSDNPNLELRPYITEEELSLPGIARITYGVEDLKGRWWVDWDHDDIVVDVYIMPPESEGGKVAAGEGWVKATFNTATDGLKITQSMSGALNINPSNNDDFEFLLVKADGTTITQDDLHANNQIEYTGYVSLIRVRPKGNGNQNSLMVDGKIYDFKNGKVYLIHPETPNGLHVHLYNKNKGQGSAMGRWWLENIQGTKCAIIESDGDAKLPNTEVTLTTNKILMTATLLFDDGSQQVFTNIKAPQAVLSGTEENYGKVITHVWALIGTVSEGTQPITYQVSRASSNRKIKFYNAASKMGPASEGTKQDTMLITATGVKGPITISTRTNATVTSTLSNVGDVVVDGNGFRHELVKKENNVYTLTIKNARNTKALEWFEYDFGSGASVTAVGGSAITANGQSVSLNRYFYTETAQTNAFTDWVLYDADNDGEGEPLPKGELLTNMNLVPLSQLAQRPNQENYLTEIYTNYKKALVVGGNPPGSTELQKIQNVLSLDSKQCCVFITRDANGNQKIQENACGIASAEGDRLNLQAMATAFVGDLATPRSSVQVLTELTGSEDLGNDDHYKTTYVNGNLVISGDRDISGAGVLVVNGNLTVAGHLHWKGIILVLGDLTLDPTAAGKNIFVNGAVLAEGEVVIDGKVDLWYSSEAIDKAGRQNQPEIYVTATPKVWRALQKGELPDATFSSSK